MNPRRLVLLVSFAGALSALTAPIPSAHAAGDRAVGDARLVDDLAPSGPPVATTSLDWVSIPDLGETITVELTSDLIASLCAEAFAAPDGARLFARVVVDGSPTSPADVVLTNRYVAETHCHSFVLESVLPGTHTIQPQWSVDGGATAYLGDRTATYTWATRSSNEVRVKQVSIEGPYLSTTSTSFVDMPNMSLTIDPSVTSDLAISFSGRVYGIGSSLWIQALVDGVTAGPGQVLATDVEVSTLRAFNFVVKDVAPGTHTVTIQWRGGSNGTPGTMYVGDRSTKVIAVKASSTTYADSLMLDSNVIGFPTVVWTNVPGMSGTIDVSQAPGPPAPTPKANLVVQFSAAAAVAGTDAMFARALLDGSPMTPGDVEMASVESAGVYDFDFLQTNVSAGSHTIDVQYLMNTASGGLVVVANSTLTAYAISTSAAGACTPALALACEDSDTRENDDYGSTDNLDTYSCSTFSYDGPEVVYEFTSPGPAKVTVTMTPTTNDLDLFVLGAGECSAQACVGSSTHGGIASETVTLPVAEGAKRFLAVDGYLGRVSPYTISVHCESTLIFADGFETGNVFRWSSHLP